MPLLVAALALSGCNKADLLNATIPGDGFAVHEGIAYARGERGKLDIYVPDRAAKPAGVVVFFYGGAWQRGSRDMYYFIGQAFASRGYVTVIPDYRIYPDAYFPDFLEDGARAVAWTHSHIARYGGDPGQMFLAGHSAGAYIAVMLAADARYLEGAGARREWIKGAIGLAGPYDFLPVQDKTIQAIFSKAPGEETQPVTFAAPGLPPMMLSAGDEDEEVPPGNTRRMAARLHEERSPVESRIYPGLGHIGIALALADGFRDSAPVLDDIDAFIRRYQGRRISAQVH